jgi:hypothetical protein
MKTLHEISEEATSDITGVLGTTLSDEQREQIGVIIEKAVIKGMLEGQHRAVDAALQMPLADQDMAHQIATAIRKKNDALIANLSSLR